MHLLALPYLYILTRLSVSMKELHLAGRLVTDLVPDEEAVWQLSI
jgi:hypothetical protein